jgi:drug/metabolite transporter (DMT)-like permease
MVTDANRFKAVRRLVLCTALWGLSFPTMKALNLCQQPMAPEAGSWFFSSLCVTYRFGLAALVMFVFAAGTIKRLTRSELYQGLGLGMFGGGGILLQMDGLAHTAASTSAFLTQCYSLLIPIWITLIERRWPAPRVLVSCLLVLAGVGVLADVNWQIMHLGRGELETLIASVLFTGQILWLQRPHYAENNVTHFSCVMFAAMSLLCAPLALLTTPHAADWVRAYSAAAPLGFLGLLVFFSTLGGYLLMNHWQRHVTATEAGLIYCIEPVFASLMALFLPGIFSRAAGIDYANETITTSLLLGGSLITAANIIIQLPQSKKNTV